MNNKDIILVVHNRNAERINRVNQELLKDKYDLVLLVSSRDKTSAPEEELGIFSDIWTVNFSNVSSLSKTLNPHIERIKMVISFGETNVALLKKVVPHLPYLNVPSSESLHWATNKILMRKRFEEYDESITPKFYIAKDISKKTVAAIEKKMDYPVIVKPTSMATSLYVTKCYHRDELEEALNKIFRKTSMLGKIRKQVLFQSEEEGNQVIVEEYMEGKMYSIDGFVDGNGEVVQYPLVHVKTGKEIGFDDFFGYQRITPVQVNQTRQDEARIVVEKAIKALKLRYVPFHIELMRLEDGWKIIEIAPRQGGYRESMYMLSYDLDITHNEYLIKTNKEPVTDYKTKGYTAVLQIFAKEEGQIAGVSGLKKVQALDSVVIFKQKLHKDNKALFAKNGGNSVFDITLHNKDRSLLLADIRRVEKDLIIKIA